VPYMTERINFEQNQQNKWNNHQNERKTDSVKRMSIISTNKKTQFTKNTVSKQNGCCYGDRDGILKTSFSEFQVTDDVDTATKLLLSLANPNVFKIMELKNKIVRHKSLSTLGISLSYLDDNSVLSILRLSCDHSLLKSGGSYFVSFEDLFYLACDRDKNGNGVLVQIESESILQSVSSIQIFVRNISSVINHQRRPLLVDLHNKMGVLFPVEVLARGLAIPPAVFLLLLIVAKKNLRFISIYFAVVIRLFCFISTRWNFKWRDCQHGSTYQSLQRDFGLQ
jgi:hypothetical protein